jgi:hydroxypyruvate reductase
VKGALCVPPGQESANLAPLTLYPAAHPLPNERNLFGASAIASAVEEAAVFDLVVCLISGGGSAHLTLPVEGLSLDDLRGVTQALLLGGAPIEDLNAVRKHCERLKGGGLARLAAPAPVWALILSDVVGDRLDVIASGPTSPDPTTYADALAVLDRYDARDASPAVTAHLEAGVQGAVPETIKAGDDVLIGVFNTIIGTNRLAVDAAADAARELGFAVQIVETPLTGEAGPAARTVSRPVTQGATPEGPLAMLYGGETTVTVRGDGLGGRNQELALAAALEIEGLAGVVVASFATDGIDGPTDAAGAIATGETVQRARDKGLDPYEYLANNDSHTFFAALGDLITTGPTGTNVNDLAFLLVY